MPEDSKKEHKKSKNDAKDQRKPRKRQQGPPVEKKSEKREEDTKVTEKPAYKPPPPEFYKNLKRETDEILKITEEENLKYKKKEIHSNWSKYEMPIESYDQINEQENMGADYEELIAAPMSLGGHFQFKHEKSWDIDTAPSLYDKYFEINMNNLAIALSTIPFHERNNIDRSMFSETDMLSMNNRSIRYKQKYYNDKSYTTPELDALEKTLNNLKDTSNETKQNDFSIDLIDKELDIDIGLVSINAEDSTKDVTKPVINNINQKENLDLDIIKDDPVTEIPSSTISKIEIQMEPSKSTMEINDDIDEILSDKVQDNLPENESVLEIQKSNAESTSQFVEVQETPNTMTIDAQKNPIIESPEDLEKWLDDFLDG